MLFVICLIVYGTLVGAWRKDGIGDDRGWRNLQPEELKDLTARARHAVPLAEAARQVAEAFPTSALQERAAANASTALRKGSDASLTACLQVDLDLTTMGAPGSTVSVGLKGTIGYNYCTSCWTWIFEARLAYLFGIQLAGRHFGVGAEVTGRLEVEEVTCSVAPDTDYCTQLAQLLPEADRVEDKVNSECHTKNPFSLVLAFISFKLKNLRERLGGDEGNFLVRNIPTFQTELEKELLAVEEGFRSYKQLFLHVDQSRYNEVEKLYTGHIFFRVLRAGWTKRERLKDLGDPPSMYAELRAKAWDGEGERTDDEHLQYFPEFRTATVENTWDPEWWEGRSYPFKPTAKEHIFRLKVKGESRFWDDRLANVDITLTQEGDTIAGVVHKRKCAAKLSKYQTFKLPLRSVLRIWFEGCSLEYIDVAIWFNKLPTRSYSKDYFHNTHYYSIKQDAISSLFGAYDSMQNKVTRYASQVLDLLVDNDEDDDLETFPVNARHLARWLHTDTQTRALVDEQRRQTKEGNSWCVNKEKLNSFKKYKKSQADEAKMLVNGFGINIPKTLRKMRVQRDRLDADYWADLATSMSNMLLRAIGDLQAIFNVYFANDPGWDGDCESLAPRFQAMYEDKGSKNGIRKSNTGLDFDEDLFKIKRMQGPGNTNRIMSRTRVGGSIVEAGDDEDDAQNPWCQRRWLAASAFPPTFLRFATADSPLGGKDGFQVEPENISGTVYPHLWCELATRWRILPAEERYHVRHCGQIPNVQTPCDESDATQPVPEPELEWSINNDVFASRGRATGGQTLRFNGACAQLSGSTLEYLEECEQVILSVSFSTIFPDLAKAMRKVYQEVGTLLEDALQCTGRIANSRIRQFPRKDDAAAMQEFLKCKTNDVRNHYTQNKAEQILHAFRRFLLQLGAEDARGAQKAHWLKEHEIKEYNIHIKKLESISTHISNVSRSMIAHNAIISRGSSSLRRNSDFVRKRLLKTLFLDKLLRPCCSLMPADECRMTMPLACSDPDGQYIAEAPNLAPQGLMDQNFYQAFAYVIEPNGLPPILTGNVYASLAIVDAALSEDLGAAERAKRGKQHVALKFRMQQLAGEDQGALMYPHFKYKEQVETAFMLNYGQRFDFCAMRETVLKFGVTPRWDGHSWDEIATKELCGWGSGSIVGHSLRIERCWSEETTGNEDEVLKYDIWRISLAAFVQDISLLDIAIEKIKAFMAQAKQSAGNALKAAHLGFLIPDNTEERESLMKKLAGNTIIQFMTSMLSKSFSLDWAATAKDKVLGTIKQAWNTAKQWIKDKVAAIGDWLEDAWDWLREAIPFDLSGDIRQRQLLTGTMQFKRERGASSKAKFSKEFSVQYTTQYAGHVKITVPGVVNIQLMAALNFNRDLSSTFNTVLVMIDGQQHQSRYDDCLKCFAGAVQARAFCPKGLSGLREDNASFNTLNLPTVDPSKAVNMGMTMVCAYPPHERGTFFVVIDRKKGEALGMDIESADDGQRTIISKVYTEGLVATAWNEDNPDELVTDGMEILSVNGQVGHFPTLRERLLKDLKLRLEVAEKDSGPSFVALASLRDTEGVTHSFDVVGGELAWRRGDHPSVQKAFVLKIETGKDKMRLTMPAGAVNLKVPNGAATTTLIDKIRAEAAECSPATVGSNLAEPAESEEDEKLGLQEVLVRKLLGNRSKLPEEEMGTRCAADAIVDVQCSDVGIWRPQECVALLSQRR